MKRLLVIIAIFIWLAPSMPAQSLSELKSMTELSFPSLAGKLIEDGWKMNDLNTSYSRDLNRAGKTYTETVNIMRGIEMTVHSILFITNDPATHRDIIDQAVLNGYNKTKDTKDGSVERYTYESEDVILNVVVKPEEVTKKYSYHFIPKT